MFQEKADQFTDRKHEGLAERGNQTQIATRSQIMEQTRFDYALEMKSKETLATRWWLPIDSGNARGEQRDKHRVAEPVQLHINITDGDLVIANVRPLSIDKRS